MVKNKTELKLLVGFLIKGPRHQMWVIVVTTIYIDFIILVKIDYL